MAVFVVTEPVVSVLLHNVVLYPPPYLLLLLVPVCILHPQQSALCLLELRHLTLPLHVLLLSLCYVQIRFVSLSLCLDPFANKGIIYRLTQVYLRVLLFHLWPLVYVALQRSLHFVCFLEVLNGSFESLA